jgi:heme/copper-type cytochrome/quinol oxidase subunit 3
VTATEVKPGQKPGPKPEPKDDLKTLPMPEVEKRLDSSPNGLSQAEATKRLAQDGPNELAEKKDNPFLKFLTYFWGPIPWMIEAAVILSGVVRHWPDFCIIFVLLLSNAVVGFWEEHQAGNAVAALKKKLASTAKVKRDGNWTDPPAREVVKGDVIRLRLGDIVPADARLLAGDPVQVDQSALTGESLPAERKPGDAVFSGSIIRQGEIDALVYATGTNTYFGKTAQLVEEAVTVSHFQRAVLKIGDYLIVMAVALVALIVTVALFRGDPILNTLEFALVLLVASIPVAMPTVLSVTMAVGARLLAKKEAVVTRLSAIEELAGVDTPHDQTWTLPSRGVVGILCLIAAESAVFIIFVVAYIFYLGKSISGPSPRDVLDVPIVGTICLLSSSLTVYLAVGALRKNQTRLCSFWLAATVVLGTIFLAGTAREWYQLIYRDGLTIRTNLFGTTFYSLVGLHAMHVVVGLIMLGLALVFALLGRLSERNAERLDVLSLYWHFVDAVWVVVFTVVYILGR